MTAKVQDLRWDQGRVFEYIVGVTFSGAVVDITGWTARMQLRGWRSLEAPLLVDIGEDEGLTVNGPDSQIIFDIGADVTALLDFDYAEYDLVLFDSTSQPFGILTGRVYLRRSVTAPV